MNEYPYLAALLPSLSFGQADFMSCGQFLREAEKWLTEEEIGILSAVDLDDYVTDEHPLELVSEWCRFERLVRRDIADFIEARRHGHDHKAVMFPTPLLKDNTPLEAERRLLKLRWDYIHRQLNVHCVDLHAFIVYKLKTQILEKLAAFDAETGKARFAELADIEELATAAMGQS